ncbi:MAG: hypothetical protein FJ042_04725 [Candidatus Cloacimonetes bacterium]|nr:hypothetical protein [Candidatus Cloacimonadota bacterium]
MTVLQTLHIPLLSLILAAVFLLLNILDAHSTWLVTGRHNYHRERNPVARWVFRKLKLPRGIIIYKTILLSGLMVAFGFYAAWDAFTLNIVLLIANLIFLAVVLNNYRIARRIKRYI